MPLYFHAPAYPDSVSVAVIWRMLVMWSARPASVLNDSPAISVVQPASLYAFHS